MNDGTDYKLGIIWQDVQHRRIIEIIKKINANQFIDYKNILDQLTFYVEDHFDTEEQYMHEVAYDKTESHIEEHKTFKNKFDELSKSYFIDNNFRLTLSSFLNDWFHNHVLVVDKELAVFLLKYERNNV
jgi:hemerythrin-like metal-binding protein